MSADNRAPGAVWGLRKNGLGYVRTLPDDQILVSVINSGSTLVHPGRGLIAMDRATARLLARRINQCLDATAKR